MILMQPLRGMLQQQGVKNKHLIYSI